MCLTVHLSVSVRVCHSLHRMALLKPTSVTRSISVSVCLCQCVTVIASSCFTQANVCDTVHLSVSVSVSVSVCGSYCIVWPYSSSRLSHGPTQCQCRGLSLIASYGFTQVCGIVVPSGLTQATVCLTIRCQCVCVSVWHRCIVWPYSSQRL